MSKAKKELDLITIGDAQLDSFVGLEEDASVSCSINKKACQLCLNYADKIPMASLQHDIAGNAANAAIGSSRLGLRSAIYTVLGGDDIADKIVNAFKKEKVSTQYVKKEKKTETNYSVVLNYEGERTQLIYNEKRKYKLPGLVKTKWVYLTALGEGSAVLHKPLAACIKKHHCRLAYNPGPHQIQDRKGMNQIMDMVDLILVNVEEAQEILGHKDGRNIKNLMKKLYHVGPKMVVVTDGPNGAYAYDGKVFLHMPVIDVPVVERTGAGDSFSTGVIAAIVKGKDLDEALRWGQFNSASVIQYIGPQKGLLKSSQMKKSLEKYKKLKAKEI